MKWQFRFESVLRFRKQLSDQAKMEYARARGELDQGLKALDELYQSIDQNFKSVQRLRESGGLQAEKLKTHDEFFTGQQIRIERQKQKRREFKQLAEEKHEKLLASLLEYKSLERLKEKQRERIKKEMGKKDQLQIDDMVTMRHRRHEAK